MHLILLFIVFLLNGCAPVSYTHVIQGTPGPTGNAGSVGETGLIGPVGPIGAVGLPGIMGPTGAVGATGSAGLQGVSGLDGTNGTNGQDGASVTTVKFCNDDTSAFPEYGIVIGSNIYAVYWGTAPYSPNTSEAFLALIKPGSYVSTGGNGCHFTVNANGTVSE